jgi:hypothetical protein
MNRTLINCFACSLMLLVMGTSCKVFRNFKDITQKPERISQELELPVQESSMNLAIKADMRSLEGEINAAFNDDIKGENTGNLEYKAWIKTKDPLYNPNEWLITKDPLYHPNKEWKTKDPFYHPNKWIKVGPFKTKDPLYHPNEWIITNDPLYHPNEWVKTKDPLYHPNEWIETRGPAISVGYRYAYSIKKKGEIRLAPVPGNKLKVSIPIEFSGWAGLEGPGADVLTLNKKNFQGAIEFFAETGVDIDSNWCPKINTVVTHKWTSNPTVEIMHDIDVSITGLADHFLNKAQKDIGAIINRKISCEQIKDRVADFWKHYAVKLPALPDGSEYFINIDPKAASVSKFIVTNDSLALYVGLKANVSVDKQDLNTRVQLPALQQQQITAGNVNAFIPLLLNYADIESNLNKHLAENNTEIKVKMLKGKASVKFKKITVYPNADELVVGTYIKTKLPGNLLPAVGWVYLTAKPVVKDNRYFELDSVDFSMDIKNKFYPAVAAVLKETIIEKIKEKSKRDLGPEFAKIESIIKQKTGDFNLPDKLDVSVDQTSVGVQSIQVLANQVAIITHVGSNIYISFGSRPLPSSVSLK